MNDFDIASQVSHIEANRTVKDALMQALRARSSKRRISVTDLLSLKQAFFRRKYPDITPTLERQQLMWSGTGFHELFGAAVSSEEYREQFVEYEGVVGKIDIFEDMPVEIKTTGRLADELDLPRKRPSYIEQLGMYCGMVGVKEGRIVIYQRDAGLTGQAPLSVCHLRFSDLEAVRSEMLRRRELLEAALASDNPASLPVCPWGDWGCDYSGVCDCKTSKVAASYAILERMELLEADEAAAREFLDKLAQPRPVGAALRLNDIVFPRKAYFARLRREAPLDEEAQEQEAREQLSSMERWGVVSALRDSLRYGSPGGTQRVPVNEGTLSDMVTLHQGQPAIVRNTALRSIVERERLPSMSPHFFLRLGFECALTGQARGRLVLYYSNVPREDAKLLVYDVSFKGVEALKAEASRRVRLLETAKGPEELPPCPTWMARYCKYSPACGCG